ncbi:HAMP domain-containing protein [Shewanella eurypsychrophilus]|uniref:histidine kinase n=1 Tax=Shewanella eurypsychrophilus TaxID=2593656 RepID=A0ABX6V4G7_9GAMM|nr:MULTISPECIES: ATP-binding protein [Shewanella]QFU22177.1 HAMP domain-containing protein [Shewanella sp. YLB-09]QPG57464.1 HAMP domain-containing protein [Shewanella eurypsychrophilus]
MLLSIKQFWTKSITRQLILGMALTHACLMTIFVFDLVHRQQTFMVSQSQKQAIGLSNTLAANGVSWVLANDVVGIEEIIASQSDFPGLTYAILLDMNNRVIGFTNREKVGQYLDDPISLSLLDSPSVSKILVDNHQFIDVASPIIFNEQQIGWARVGIDRKEITNNLKLVTRNGLLYTLLAISVGVIFAYLMGRGLTQAIRTLVESTNLVERGESDVEFTLERSDELGQLSKYLDKTVKTLAMNEVSLKQNQRILESQVRDRTFKLEQANIELTAYSQRVKDEKDKLDQAYHQLKALQQQLIESEKLSALGSLVAGIAHEVNTPLGVGYTGISVLQEQLDILHKHIVDETLTAEDITEFLEHSNEIVSLISKNMQRATQLIKSFKQIAVVQTSAAHYEFSLKEIVDDCVLSLNNKLKQKSIKIDIDIDEQLRIDSEPGPFAQVISNFVMNSVIHGFEGLNTGVILIHASLTETELTIAYSDDGKGMSNENVKKVYEPFFTTKMGSGGSGLGMHVVYNIITQRFNGQINCKSTLGEGVSYNIIIPISAL